MGIYINPTTTSKEEWLLAHDPKAIIEPRNIVELYSEIRGQDLIPLVWVDSGGFTALGVMYNKSEAVRMTAPDDRPKVYCLVRLQDVLDPEAGLPERDRQVLNGETTTGCRRRTELPESCPDCGAGPYTKCPRDIPV